MARGAETGLPTLIEIQSYRLDPGSYDAVGKARLRRSSALGLVFAFVLLLAIGAPASMIARGREAYTFVEIGWTMAIALLFAAPVVWWRRRAHLEIGRRAWVSYLLTVGPNVMRRSLSRLPTLEILRSEVTEIVDQPNRGLTVETQDRYRFIFVPKEVVGYGALRSALADWHPIATAKAARGAVSRGVALAWVAILAASASTAAASRDLRVVLLATVIFYSGGGFVLRETLRSNVASVENRAKLVAALFICALVLLLRLVVFFAYPSRTGALGS